MEPRMGHVTFDDSLPVAMSVMRNGTREPDAHAHAPKKGQDEVENIRGVLHNTTKNLENIRKHQKKDWEPPLPV